MAEILDRMLYYSDKPNIRHLNRISRISTEYSLHPLCWWKFRTETLWIRKQPLITPSGKNKIVFQTFCDTLYYSTVKPTRSICAAIENTGNNFYIEIKTDNTQDSFSHMWLNTVTVCPLFRALEHRKHLCNIYTIF